MKLLNSYVRYSAKNGLIVVHHLAGAGEVVVRGAKQTSKRYPAMWADACRRTLSLRPAPVKKILLLGLAGGGALAPLYEAFPGCTITAVEHDEDMIEIARELRLFAPHPEPAMLCMDAHEAVRMPGAYDLIVVDLFFGLRPASVVSRPEFWSDLSARLSPSGSVLINACINPEMLELASAEFREMRQWIYNANTFGLAWTSLRHP